MEAIYVLLRRNGHQDSLFINAFGQRKLTKDAVNILPSIQCFNECNEFLLRRLFRHGVLFAQETAIFAVLPFAVDINAAGGIVSNDNDRQTRLPLEAFCLFLYCFLAFGCQGFAI